MNLRLLRLLLVCVLVAARRRRHLEDGDPRARNFTRVPRDVDRRARVVLEVRGVRAAAPEHKTHLVLGDQH